MNILSLFPAVPLLMMLGLWVSRNTKQIHAVMVAGSSVLLGLAVALVFIFLGMRADGQTAEMLLTDSFMWYKPLNIEYAVGVDGISVAMILLSAIIVFTGTFASWKMKDGVNLTARDILENPKNLKIIELEAPQLPRTLSDTTISVSPTFIWQP